MSNRSYHLKTDYDLKGDQPKAVKKIVSALKSKEKDIVLLGVTGSGKTFTMANVIKKLNRPALIISPNKTLAGQLYNEFKELFPENAVEYFVSYYDYYQPEAYVPSNDLFIEKDASINDRIDRLRHSATTSVLERNDCVIIASVSCIYGLGNPDIYRELSINIKVGQEVDRDDFLRNLISIQYERNDIDFSRGSFRVRGDIVDVISPATEARAFRISFFDDEIESIKIMDPLTGDIKEVVEEITVFPAKHYATTREIIEQALIDIKKELDIRVKTLKDSDHLLEAQRLQQRTSYDLEMIRETGFCSGIENYSRYLDGRKMGEPPKVLIDFFPKDFLVFIDESHITVPQINGMFKGDQSRKRTLVEFGFRLPSALDNRPLNFKEFEKKMNQVVYVSATPGDYELELGKKNIIEQIIRPTGLLDPLIEIKPTQNQVKHLESLIEEVISREERVLVTTLTKKMAEKLTDYYKERGFKVRYLHSDIATLERMEIIRDLRNGEFDVLIGINLLREGLDIPEVSLVGVLEADVEGFLRSRRSLIQLFGRAARNTKGKVILYADKETPSMKQAIDETNRRRAIQKIYNKKNGITPETIKKSRESNLLNIYDSDYFDVQNNMKTSNSLRESSEYPINGKEVKKQLNQLRKEMAKAAKHYHFEEAAKLRDEIWGLEEQLGLLENDLTIKRKASSISKKKKRNK